MRQRNLALQTCFVKQSFAGNNRQLVPYFADEPRKPTPVTLIESTGQSDGSSRMTSVSDDTELQEDEMHCGSFPATETLQRNQSAHSVSTLQSTEYEDSWSADS